ncbi:MAG: hypothetical protein IJU44_13235 [Kiritimatiellae bacterium]|nr:hypothetical protein [Kiritimatiellia bacterium]
MGENKKASLEKSIFKAGFIVLIAHLLFKFAGLIQAKVMGHCLPQEVFDVVYVAAFENCIFMLFLIGQEILGPAFLPVFMREMNESGGEDSAWSFANTVLTLQFIILVAAAAILAVFPNAFVRFFTQWTADGDPEKFRLCAKSIRLLSPTLIGLSLGTTTYLLLNGYKRFFLAALGDAVWKFVAIGFLVSATVFSKDTVTMLLCGLVAGAFCKVGTHVLGLRDKVRKFRPMLDFKSPAFKSLCLLVLPLLIGIFVSRARDIFNNVYVLSSLKESGLMQANSMGRKLQSTFLFLVPYTLSVVAFPYFCELVDKNDTRKIGELLTKFGRILLALFTPFAVYVAVSAVPMTSLLFKGGHFDSTAVTRTAVSLACYTAVLPAAALEALFMQAFFANRRMISLTVIGIVFSILSMLLSWLGMTVFGPRNSLMFLASVAGGFALTRSLKTVALVQIFKQTAPVFPVAQTCGFLVRVVLASVVAAAAGWFTGMLLNSKVLPALHLEGRQADIVWLGAVGAVFGAVYLAGAWLLKLDEIRGLPALLKRRKSS